MNKQNSVTIEQLKRHNDGQGVSLFCMFFRHKWSEKYFVRVKGGHGTHLCEVHECTRCGRYKIGEVLKKKLNRASRRR